MAVIARKSNGFAKEVCQIFGFDPNVTKSITIKIVPDDLVIVEAETILTEQMADAFLTGTNQYQFKAYAKDSEDRA